MSPMELERASGVLSRDRLAAPYYWQFRDSEFMVAATTKLDFGVTTAGKSPFRCNFPQFPLPRPWIFYCFGLTARVMQDTSTAGTTADNHLTSLVSVLEDNLVTFKVNAKNYLEADLLHLASGGGAYGFVESDGIAAATRFEDILTNGVPAPNFRAMFANQNPVVINYGEQFRVTVEWGHALDLTGFLGTTGLLMIEWIGILDRGVQT